MPMREWADFIAETGADGAISIALSGPLCVSSVGRIDDRLRAIEGQVEAIDLSKVDDFDTVGAWIVVRLSEERGAKITGGSEEAMRLIAAVRGQDTDENPDGETSADATAMKIAPGQTERSRNWAVSSLVILMA